MFISSYTKSIEELITANKISLFHRNWKERKDGTFDYDKEHWCANKYNGSQIISALGDTPRDAIVNLFKQLE